MSILNDFINQYDDGRSKSYFCLSCTLLPLETLKSVQKEAGKTTRDFALKEKNKLLKGLLQAEAEKIQIDLKLKHK